MRLSQENLDRYGALFIQLDDFLAVGVEPCESEGDLEMPEYRNIGTVESPLWQQTGDTFGDSPYENLKEICKKHETLANRNFWKDRSEVEFH